MGAGRDAGGRTRMGAGRDAGVGREWGLRGMQG